MMSFTLSPRVRRSLKEIQQKLHPGQPQVRCSLKSATMQQFLRWCQEHEVHLGARQQQEELLVDKLLLVQVEKTLAELGQQPLNPSKTLVTREDQARVGIDEFKNQGETPREARLLVSLPPQFASLGAICLQAPPRVFIDLDWRDLDLNSFDLLLVVENLDSFYSLQDPEQLLALNLQRPLLVYRGDQVYAKAVKRLKSCCQDLGKPCVYLGDFDAKGVNIALNEGYSHLLLPPLSFLKQQAVTLHQPAEQLRYQKSLRAKLQALGQEHPLAGYLQLLINEQRGLKQQSFPKQDLQLWAWD